VCSIYCATANPAEVIVAESAQGRGVPGVIDGAPPKGVKGPSDVHHRKEFLRKIGYKLCMASANAGASAAAPRARTGAGQSGLRRAFKQPPQTVVQIFNGLGEFFQPFRLDAHFDGLKIEDQVPGKLSRAPHAFGG